MSPQQVTKARRKFTELVDGGGLAGGAGGSLPWDALLRGVMGDAELAPVAELPRTGVPPEAELRMSAAFVAPWQHPVRLFRVMGVFWCIGFSIVENSRDAASW